MAAILSRPQCVNKSDESSWRSPFRETGILGYCNVSYIAKSHYRNVIMGTMASQIINLTIVYSTVYSGADHREHQSSVARGIHRWPVNSPHKWPVTRKMFLFDGVIMKIGTPWNPNHCFSTTLHFQIHAAHSVKYVLSLLHRFHICHTRSDTALTELCQKITCHRIWVYTI